jgi:hypothetical protein
VPGNWQALFGKGPTEQDPDGHLAGGLLHSAAEIGGAIPSSTVTGRGNSGGAQVSGPVVVRGALAPAAEAWPLGSPTEETDMPEPSNTAGDRRRFLRLLLSSLAVPSVSFATLERLLAALDGEAAKVATGALQGAPLISAPEQAVNVMDFEVVGREKLPPAHFGYLATGVDDDATLRANREGFARYQIRPRRLVDVQKIDMSVKLLGTTWDNPIVLAPAGSQRAFHPDGELATARAARSKGHLQMLSTVTTVSVEEVIAARDAPVWYQLYPTSDWNITRAMIRRAETAGCPVLVFTVDLQGVPTARR